MSRLSARPGARHALRGTLVSLRDDPFQRPSQDCLTVIEDGLVVIEDGRIAAVGDHAALAGSLASDCPIEHFPHAMIVPGFIDTHVHYPQLEMIGAFGEQLLAWLERYTFPTEARFAEPAHAARVADLFLRELLRAGTTTAAVYCTVHPQSVDAFFEASARFNTRMVAGKVLMDRNAPDNLRDTAQQGYRDSRALIDRWHRKGRQLYAVTPRFAPTSTQAQLEAAGALLRETDDLFVQTHISENRAEVEWVHALFPERANYLDVYAHAGLVGPRTVLGHGVHLEEAELCDCHRLGAAIAHCPTSNMFLGSGLFRLFDAVDPRRPVRVGLGTDVGAGTSLSPLVTLGAAYKVAALNGTRLDAVQAFHLATLGGARALYLDDRLGTLAPGKEADICVLDPRATPVLATRSARSDSVEDLMFSLMTLGDDRAVQATYVAGHPVYRRDNQPDPFSLPPA